MSDFLIGGAFSNRSILLSRDHAGGGFGLLERHDA
jgi:hypothetical protein